MQVFTSTKTAPASDSSAQCVEIEDIAICSLSPSFSQLASRSKNFRGNGGQLKTVQVEKTASQKPLNYNRRSDLRRNKRPINRF
jgi:hypothetical protein